MNELSWYYRMKIIDFGAVGEVDVEGIVVNL